MRAHRVVGLACVLMACSDDSSSGSGSGGSGSSGTTSFEGRWCGKDVDRAEDCVGGEPLFFNIKDVGSDGKTSVYYCESYLSADCASSKEAKVQGNVLTFVMDYGDKTIEFTLTHKTTFLEGQAVSSKASAPLPLKFYPVD